jgi:eukaryotic-like serine/threonine-protein kinase
MELDFEAGRVRLRGLLNEHVDFAPLLKRVQPGLVLDLGELGRVNSYGAREWVNFMKAVPEGSLVLERCPVSFIMQLNLIENFARGARVKNFMVPYLCSGCDEVGEQLIEVASLDLAAVQAGPMSRCGARMELDVLPEQYFAFVPPRRLL